MANDFVLQGLPINRDELKEIIKESLREELPDAMRRELELLGLDASDAESRAEVREDLRFARTFRRAFDGVARKIGYGILWFAVVGFIAFALSGFKIKLGS